MQSTCAYNNAIQVIAIPNELEPIVSQQPLAIKELNGIKYYAYNSNSVSLKSSLYRLDELSI
jgi:hypothetical protein